MRPRKMPITFVVTFATSFNAPAQPSWGSRYLKIMTSNLAQSGCLLDSSGILSSQMFLTHEVPIAAISRHRTHHRAACARFFKSTRSIKESSKANIASIKVLITLSQLCRASCIIHPPVHWWPVRRLSVPSSITRWDYQVNSGKDSRTFSTPQIIQ